MTYEVLNSMARPMIAALVTYLATKYGFFDSTTWNLIVTGGVTIVLAAWAGWRRRPNGLIASVDALAKQPNSPVKAIITDQTAAGRQLAASLPGNTTVMAGTQAAIQAAR